MNRRRRSGSFGFFFFICLFLFFYFGFYALWGPRGYLNYRERLAEVEALEQEHDHLVFKREKLERRVTALSSKSLDLDMLEERARLMLNYSYDNDYVIYGDLD
jgi:cell division protein FtsB